MGESYFLRILQYPGSSPLLTFVGGGTSLDLYPFRTLNIRGNNHSFGICTDKNTALFSFDIYIQLHYGCSDKCQMKGFQI